MSRTLFLDLDGVFVDLHPCVVGLHGLTFSEPELLYNEWNMAKSYVGMTEERMWGHDELREAKFWANLPKTEWADRLMLTVRRYFAPDELCFLTKPLPGTGSAHGKQEWVERCYPGMRFLIGDGKAHCAGPGKFLLDDATHNINEFNAAGGRGILFPRQWNLGGYQTDPVRYVDKALFEATL